MVRLKEHAFSCVHGRQRQFQFHYGTIKSQLVTPSWTSITIFQFHYGTIKSGSFQLILIYCVNFNSTMVRLKAQADALIRESNAYFNSTMVRLKGLSFHAHNARVLFQFHYGTIKSHRHYNAGNCKKISIPLWYD